MTTKSGSDVTIPTYYAGIVFVLGHGPWDKVTHIHVDSRLAWFGEANDPAEVININSPELFGGTGREGGIVGPVSFKFGRLTQAVPNYIKTWLRKGVDTPAFRGVMLAILEEMYLGTNYYLKPWWFMGTRIHLRKHGIAQWQDSLSEITIHPILDPTFFIFLSHSDTTAIVAIRNLAGIHVNSVITVTGASYAAYNGTFTVTAVDVTTRIFNYTMGSVPAGDSTITTLQITYSLKDLINAVHVIRDCLTDSSWGLGHPEYSVDETTFLAAAQTCYDEGLGFGFLWTGERPVTDFIDMVLKHIQGSLYVNRVTGKFELKLLRYITDTTDLILLNDSNISEVVDFKRLGMDDLVNQVTIKFLDNSTLEDNDYTASDPALFQRQGSINSKTITYEGITNLSIAQRFALRDLHQLSIPIYSGTIKCTRVAENLNPGDAVRFYKTDIINAELIMRVDKINLGTIDKGEITLDLVQDFFHAADTVYYSPESSDWDDPIEYPIAVTYKLVDEVPYYMVAIKQGDSFAQAVDVTASYLSVAAVSPQLSAYSAGLWTGPSATSTSLSRYGIVDFCFSALLGNTLTKTSTSVDITDVIDPGSLTLNSFIQLGNEFMQVTAITDTNLTVVRGILDTVPDIHAIGDRLWGIQDFSNSDNVLYAIGETTYVSLTTITPKGELTLANADVSVTFDGRLHMPYPPGDFKIDGSYWPTTHATGTVPFTWAHRNRIQQTAGLIGYYTASVTTEASVTYDWELIKTSDSSVLDSGTGLTTDNTSFTTAYTGEVKLRLWSVRSILTSLQTVEHIFTLT